MWFILLLRLCPAYVRDYRPKTRLTNSIEKVSIRCPPETPSGIQDGSAIETEDNWAHNEWQREELEFITQQLHLLRAILSILPFNSLEHIRWLLFS